MCECKVCGESKVRQNGGKRTGCTGFYKVDGAGRRWNGLTCPDCKGANVGIRRDEPQDSFGPAQPLFKYKLRSCKECGDNTPNYYRCAPCNTRHMNNNDHMYYGGYSEDMYAIEIGSSRVSSRKAGFHY